MKRFSIAAISIIAALGLVFCISGCSNKSEEDKGSVAATVNGESIYENDVTAYVDQMRNYFGATDDTDWATFLSEYGYDPSSIREMAINALAQDVVIEQAASDAGVTVSDDDIDSYISDMREQLGYTNDDDWTSALTSAGYADENAYRDVVKTELLKEALYSAEVEQPTPTDDEIASAASSYAGEKASHILVADADTANAIADRINSATDKATQFASELSATQDTGDSALADSDGNLGWTSVNYQVYYYKLTNCATALASMNVGDVQVVQETDGYHVLYCTDKFTAPSDGSTVDITTIPADLKADITSSVQSSDYSTACSDYLSGLTDAADIQINDMPEGLSYDVDMSLAETSSTSSTGTTTGTTSSTTGTTSTGSSDASSIQYYSDDQGTYYLDSDGNKVYINVTDTTSTTDTAATDQTTTAQ